MKHREAFQSKYLKAADLGGEAVRTRVEKVKWETVGDDRKPVMTFAGGHLKPLPLDRTNFEACTEAFGTDEPDNWADEDIEVFPIMVTDPQGRTVDDIRLRGVDRYATFAPNARARHETASEPNPPAIGYDNPDDQIPDEDSSAPEVRG